MGERSPLAGYARFTPAVMANWAAIAYVVGGFWIGATRVAPTEAAAGDGT
jgi:hypothetical protein